MLAGTCAIATGFVAGRAEADPEPSAEGPAPFGSSGQFVLSVDRLASVGLSVARWNDSGTSREALDCSSTNVDGSFFGSQLWMTVPCAWTGRGGIAWGADVFVARGVSLGGSLSFSSTSKDYAWQSSPNALPTPRNQESSSAFTLSPRVGYAHALGSSWAIWPRAGIDWNGARVENDSHSTTTDGTPVQSRTTSSFRRLDAAVDVRFVFSPIPHVAFFGGPYATLPIWSHIDRDMEGHDWLDGTYKVYEVGVTAGALVYF